MVTMAEAMLSEAYEAYEAYEDARKGEAPSPLGSSSGCTGSPRDLPRGLENALESSQVCLLAVALVVIVPTLNPRFPARETLAWRDRDAWA